MVVRVGRCTGQLKLGKGAKRKILDDEAVSVAFWKPAFP